MIDSVDKIVTRYFSVVTKEDFEWKGTIFYPKSLQISPLLFRDYTCPSNCGGCCPRFSLDYLPNEEKPEGCLRRRVKINENTVIIYSDLQKDHINHHCRYLNKENARCAIHIVRPFSCDFELIRPLSFLNPNHPNVLTQKLFGRGWNMTRIDSKKGALCKITPVTEKSIEEVIRKIKRLNEWCEHFGIESKCPEIIKWCEDAAPFILHTHHKITNIII